MIARIIPTETSFDTYGLSYFVPDSIAPEIGEVLEIPLGDEISYGVFAGPSESQIGASEIKSVVGTTGIRALDPGTVRAVSVLAKRHAIHIHKVLSLFLPKGTFRRMLKYGIETGNLPWSEPTLPTLRFVSNPKKLGDEIQKIADGFRTAFIFPNDSVAERETAFLDENETARITSELTDAKREKLQIAWMEWKYRYLV